MFIVVSKQNYNYKYGYRTQILEYTKYTGLAKYLDGDLLLGIYLNDMDLS